MTTKKKAQKTESFPKYASKDVLKDMIKGGEDPFEIMANMKKAVLEAALEAELDEHLKHDKYEKSADGNYRNGHGCKTVHTDNGSVEIKTPRDREGSFEPQLIAKRQRSLKGFDDVIIAMYARGMSTRDIQSHLRETYKTDVSHELIANVTDAVLEEVTTWQSRPLDCLYTIVYLDAMVIKAREGKHIVNKSLYIAMGVDTEGKKHVLGLWLAKAEGAKFWLSVLNELKNRGVQDILIACCDGLSGFPDAINATFPKTTVQLCIVHMIRNSLKFVSYKDYKAVVADLKPIYTASFEEEALQALSHFSEKWDLKYPMISRSWLNKWTEITPFLQFPEFIRRAIYTTNVIEASNRQVRKVIKTKGSFPNDDAVYKIVFLALQNAQKKWTMPIKDWALALNQFHILFPDRI